MSKKKKKDKADEVKPEKSKSPKKVAVKAPAAKPKKAAAPKKSAPDAKTVKAAVAISNDDIALRAYFIAERRRQEGGHGDEHADWIEAERQLRAEAGL